MKKGCYTLFMLIIMVLIPTYVYGLTQKSSYTDVCGSEDFDQTIRVELMGTKDINRVLDGVEEKLRQCPIVLKVRAQSAFEYYAREGRQKAEVIDVLKGEEPKKGEEIYITSEKKKMIDSGYFLFIGTGYTNFMKVGEEYIVFIDGLADNRGVEKKAYNLYYKDMLLCPVFPIAEHDNIIPREGVIYNFVLYREVKENEVFVDSNEALQKYLQLKENIMEEYGR